MNNDFVNKQPHFKVKLYQFYNNLNDNGTIVFPKVSFSNFQESTRVEELNNELSILKVTLAHACVKSEKEISDLKVESNDLKENLEEYNLNLMT